MTSTLRFYLAHLRQDRRYIAMIGLGFASGIPYLLVYVTQSSWLYQAKVPIETIGLMSELTIAYKFKFLWAPFLDRYDAPLFTPWLGRRRAWILVSQILVAIGLAGVAFGDPGHWILWTVLFSLILGFAGATQDVVVDGWRITAAPKDKQSLMTSFSEIGYRVGVLCAGAGALYIADAYGWKAAYLVMAALMIPGAFFAWVAPEPESDFHVQHDNPEFWATIIAPIKDLARRLGPTAIPIFILIAGFRMPGYISNAMAMPLFKSLDISDSHIATVTKMFGFWVALGGTFLSAYLVPRLGMMASLLLATIAASASHLSLAYLAATGANDFMSFTIAVSIDSFAAAFATIVLITFMSSLASDAMAASQYALMTSLCALPGSILAGFSGYIIHDVGFTLFFIGTSLIGLPVAILCYFMWRGNWLEGKLAASAGNGGGHENH